MKRERFGRLLPLGLTFLALAGGVAIYLCGLEATPMQPGNEAMYAYPAIVMLNTGDFLVPQYEQGPFLEKPPLTWWILAASYRMLGVSIFAERLPGALAALATVLAVALWVRRRHGMDAALAAALALIYTFKFAAFARTSAADTFLTLAVTLAVFALDRAARDPDANDRKLGILCGGALALAFGFKGLVGLVLPIGGVVAGLLLDRARPVRVFRRGGIALATLITLTAPWHWAMSERFGAAFWKLFYWDNQFLRGSTNVFMENPRGLFYYVGILALSAFPWTMFVPSALFDRRSHTSSAPVGWLLFGMLFLSAMTMKRELYLMPLFPAVAVIAGEYLRTPEMRRPGRRWLWAAAALAPVVCLVFWFRMREVLPRLAGRDTYNLLGVALALLLLSLVAAARFDASRWPRAAVGAGCGLFFLAFLLAEARLSRYDPFSWFGQHVSRECGKGCEGYRVRLAWTSLDYYSRFEWGDVADAREIPARLRSAPVYAVLRSSEEAVLRSTGRAVGLVDRRPWLNENWVTAALHPERFRLVQLSLVRLDDARDDIGGIEKSDSSAALPLAAPRSFIPSPPAHRLWRSAQ